MVINIGALKSGLDDVVYSDIRAVAKVCTKGRGDLQVYPGNMPADR